MKRIKFVGLNTQYNHSLRSIHDILGALPNRHCTGTVALPPNDNERRRKINLVWSQSVGHKLRPQTCAISMCTYSLAIFTTSGNPDSLHRPIFNTLILMLR